MNRKGQFPEDIGWTLIVLVAVVFIGIVFIMYALVITRLPIVGSGPMSTSLEFVHLSNRPYVVTEAMMHRMIDDRQMLEHAIEMAFVKSLEGSSSIGIEDDIKYVMDHFDLKYYQIIIKDGEGNEIIDISKKITACEDAAGNSGVCTSRFYNPENNICGMGADRIDDYYSVCPQGELCCLDYEYRTDGYTRYQSRINPSKILAPCGPDQNKKFGICDYGRGGIKIFKKLITSCRPGREQVEQEDVGGIGECKARTGFGSSRVDLVCCVPTSFGSDPIGFGTKSTVPLLYKSGGIGGSVGYLEVVTGA